MSEYEIRRSEIHGRGVFATKDYKRGDLVGVYEGIVTCRTIRSRFFLILGDTEVCGWGVQGTGPLKYMNSAGNDATCRVADDLGIYAVRRIRPGDELTFDYSFGPR